MRIFGIHIIIFPSDRGDLPSLFEERFECGPESKIAAMLPGNLHQMILADTAVSRWR